RGAHESEAALAVCVVRACNLDTAAASLTPAEIKHVLRTQARRLHVLCGGSLPVAQIREDTLGFAVTGKRALKAAFDDAAAAVQALSKEISLERGAFSPRVSAGIAHFPDDAGDPEEAIDKALSALAVSVQHGTRQVLLYNQSAQDRVRDALELERSLREAVVERKLDVVFQPIVDAQTGRTLGAEALVRWRHPVHGVVPPSTFIPLAERCGLVAAIDRFVLEEAGRRTMAWRSKLAMPELFVSVNLSATQFRDTHLTGWIASLLHGALIDPSAVVLEVTETAALHDVDHGSKVVNQLRDLGVRVALDDFGTGHSWLSYLSRIDVDRIKIDRSFVRDVHVNARHRAICEAVVALARGLSLRVVAEGVEREEEARCLRELGVH
ncbi:MAG: EAL domain-containing protein, partial [Polyangiaceae bacterium]|nr:EAL domain-containing protein [Polyangiaceae bacterium]